MCGILVAVRPTPQGSVFTPADTIRLQRGLQLLRDRGPDDTGVYHGVRCLAGHTRLAILDLDQRSSQPFRACEDRYVLVYNGEIYNFRELKEELEQLGHEFVTAGDTEVLMAALIQWGQSAVNRLCGMYAFVFIDQVDGTTIVSRDELGIKPLYFAVDASGLHWYCSSIPPLLNVIDVNNENNTALTDYLFFGSSLGSLTFYSEITAVTPAKKEKDINVIAGTSGKRGKQKLPLSGSKMAQTVVQTLQDVVRDHFQSDVPTACLLSGGIDSACIVAFADEETRGGSKFFTADFGTPQSVSEVALASNVAKHFNLDHEVLKIESSPPSILAHLDKLLSNFGQPFSDPAAITLMEIYSAIPDYIKVVVQGDGGDEMFGGYERYRRAIKFRRMAVMSERAARCLCGFLSRFGVLNEHGLRNLRALLISDPLAMTANYLDQNLPGGSLQKLFRDSAATCLTPGARYRQELAAQIGKDEDIRKSMMSIDKCVLLPSIYLPKVDCASMSYSLEARVPFLDKRVIELSQNLPPDAMVSASKTKIVLREVLGEKIPGDVLSAPKMGFGSPVSTWMKGELGEVLYNEASATEIFNRRAIEKELRLHRSGKRSRGLMLWKALVLARWLNRNLPVQMAA